MSCPTGAGRTVAPTARPPHRVGGCPIWFPWIPENKNIQKFMIFELTDLGEGRENGLRRVPRHSRPYRAMTAVISAPSGRKKEDGDGSHVRGGHAPAGA